MTDETWDAAVVAARSKGSPLGRVAKRFGVSRQDVLDAQERFNRRRDAARAEAREAAAALAAKEALEREAIRREPKPKPVVRRIDPAELMTLDQLASRWRCSTEQAARAVRLGDVPTFGARFVRSEVLAWELSRAVVHDPEWGIRPWP